MAGESVESGGAAGGGTDLLTGGVSLLELDFFGAVVLTAILVAEVRELCAAIQAK